MKAIRKAPVTFGYMELCQNQERAVCVFVRGLNDELQGWIEGFEKGGFLVTPIATPTQIGVVMGVALLFE